MVRKKYTHPTRTKGLSPEIQPNYKAFHSHDDTDRSCNPQDCKMGDATRRHPRRVVFVEHADELLPIQPVVGEHCATRLHAEIDHTPEEHYEWPSFGLDNQEC